MINMVEPLLLFFTMLRLWLHVTSLTQSVYVKEGSTTQLECPQLTESISTTWKGPLSEYPISDGRHISHYFKPGKFNVIGNFSDGEYTLVINNVTTADIGDYLCDIVADEKPLQHTVELILAQPPTQMAIHETDIVNRIHGLEGHIINLTCTVKSGQPNETLIWTSQGTVLKIGGPRILTFNMVAKRIDHLQHYTCLANNSAVQNPLTKTIQLDIEFKPYVWTNGSTLLSITEGQALSITCYQSSNPPSSGPKWWKLNGMSNMDLFANDSGLHIIVVTRRDAGTYICGALNKIGTGSTNISINVLYPPTVRLVYDNYTETEKRREILCVPNGNPASYIFSKWEHKSEFGERIRYLNGYLNGSLVLPYRQSHSYQDTGIYKCTVSNGIPDTHGQFNQSQDGFLAIQGKPIILDSNQNIFFGIIDTPTYIRLEVYSVPKFTETQLQDINGVFLNRQGKATITDETAVLKQRFHSTLIKLNGYRLIINFSTFSIKDIGNYSLNIDNSYGKDTKNFTIQVANPPYIPMNVSIKHLVNAVIISWHKNFDGGFEQTFYIEYKIEGKRNWKSVESLNTTSSAEVSWQITGLRSSQTYFFRMFARNSLGESSRTDVQIIKTKGIGHDEGDMLFIYAVISSAVGMSTIILSAVICYCIKKKLSCENASREVTIDIPNIYDEIPSDHIPENTVSSNTAEVHDESMIITGLQIMNETQIGSESTACGSQSEASQVNDDYLHPCVKGQSDSDSWRSDSGDLEINPDYLDPFVKTQSMSDSGSCSSRNEYLQMNNDYLHPYVSLQPNWKEISKAEGMYMQHIK